MGYPRSLALTFRLKAEVRYRALEPVGVRRRARARTCGQGDIPIKMSIFISGGRNGVKRYD